MALRSQEWADLLLVVPSVVTLLIIMTENQYLDHLDGRDLTVAPKDIAIVNLSIRDGGPLSISIEDAVAVDHRNVTAVDLIAMEEDRNVAVAAQELTDLIHGLVATLISIAADDRVNLDAPSVILEEHVKDVTDLATAGLIAVVMLLAANRGDHATTTAAKNDQDVTAKTAANLNLAAVEKRKIVKVTVV